MTKSFDVFLSHNTKDKPAVRELAEALRDRGLEVWLDEWELVPGQPWQEALEEVIETCRSSAVLVGKDGLGPWQDAEMRGCLSEFVTRNLPVIPVLLPGAPEAPRLPFFLKRFTWVDLREGMTQEGIDRLLWGATGRKPDRTEPPSISTATPEPVAATEMQSTSAARPTLPEVEEAAVTQERSAQKARPGLSSRGTRRRDNVRPRPLRGHGAPRPADRVPLISVKAPRKVTVIFSGLLWLTGLLTGLGLLSLPINLGFWALVIASLLLILGALFDSL